MGRASLQSWPETPTTTQQAPPAGGTSDATPQPRAAQPTHLCRSVLVADGGWPAFGRSFGSAGINRHRERNGRVRHRRSSAPRWPRPCVGVRKGVGEALDRGTCRQGDGPAKSAFRGADVVRMSGRQHRRRRRLRAVQADPPRSENLCMQGVSIRENREIPRLPVPLIGVGPSRDARGRTPGMYERGKSDRLVVPTKPPNKAMAAEVVERRGRGEGNPDGTTRPGHRAGSGVPYVPDRVRRTAVPGQRDVDHVPPGVGPCDV